MAIVGYERQISGQQRAAWPLLTLCSLRGNTGWSWWSSIIIISLCFVNLAAAAIPPIILLPRNSWDAAVIYIRRLFPRGELWTGNEPHWSRELMKMLPWLGVVMSEDCDEGNLESDGSGHPIIGCDQVSRCHETSGDICDTIPACPSHEGQCLWGIKFQILCDLSILAI